MLAVFVGTGCGSSTSKPSATNTSRSSGSSQANFAAQANKVCTDAARQAGRLPGTSTQAGAAQLDTFARQNAIARDQAAKLRAVAVPPSVRQAYDKYVADIDRRNSLDDQIVAALRAGNRPLAGALSARAKANRNAAEATQLGLTDCAVLDAQ